MGLDLSGLEEFDARLGALLDAMPDARRHLHEQLADIAKGEVDSAIASTVNDSQGRVRSWQARHVGSGGGYAAVRPKGSKEGATTGPNGPGAITNYLEHGFKHRRSGRFVLGRGFYANARANVQSRAIQLVSSYVDWLSSQLEG